MLFQVEETAAVHVQAFRRARLAMRERLRKKRGAQSKLFSMKRMTTQLSPVPAGSAGGRSPFAHLPEYTVNLSTRDL